MQKKNPDKKEKLPLTPKMEKFAESYVNCGGNGRQAALTISTRNIRLPHVLDQIWEHIGAQLPGALAQLQEVIQREA